MKDKERLFEFVKNSPDPIIQDAIFKAERYVENHDTIICAISGGSDSDIMLDLLYNVDDTKKIKYVWCDTGLEYQATKDHLKHLEEKYNIKIEVVKAKVPIPTAIKKFGYPFLSKQISEYIMRLQKHNFQWEDEPFDVLYKRYPQCKGSLRWWCNDWGENSKFNISYTPFLKEFLIMNHPVIPISPRCCYYAKKSPLNSLMTDEYELNCVGIRKSEGGARSTAYKSCYSPTTHYGYSQYRPIFWFTNDVKKTYKLVHNIIHSDCYELWGMDRTGCAGCPFGKYFEYELSCMERFEPKMYKAVMNIFGPSYDFTRRFREFQKEMRGKTNVN